MALHDTWDGNWDGFEVKKEAVDWSEFTPVDEPEPEPKPGSLFTDNQIVPDTEYTDEGWMQSANQQRGVDKIATKGVTAAMGLAEIAARQDPTPSSLILDEAKDFSPWTFSPIAAITNAMSSILVKETVDVVDMFTEGDIRKEVIDASQLIREDSARILGNPNIQYQGNAGTRFGYEVMEAAVNMGGALMVGYVTRNRGLALGVIGAQVGGGTYQDYMVKTKGDHDKSMLAAKFHVVAEVLPETIPVFAMLRKTKVGEGVTRMLEATIGEGVQEMLTSILTQAYDNKQLENMSLKEAILGIDWGNVLYEGAIGVFVGATLSAPGAMGDYLEGRRQGEGPPPDTTLDDELTPDFQIKTLEDNADVIGDLIEQIPELPKPSGDVADKGEGWVDVDAELEEGDAELKQWAEEKARELSQEKPKELGLDAPESVKLADDAEEEKRAKAVVDIKAKLEGEGIEFGGPPKPAEKLEKASETISNDALKAVDAAMAGFPKDITDLSDEKHDELIKLIKSRRDIVDQIDHGLSPRKTSEERTRLIKELHAQNKTPRKYATISDMMEQLGGVGAPSKLAEITPAEVKAATEPVEPTGEAIKAAEDFREVRPEFKGLILSFKPGDDRDGRPTPNFYGEIADTEDADGMPIDVVLSKDFVTDVEDPVFIINQKDWDTGEFRQHKVMAGFAEMAEAEQSFFDQWGESGWGSTHELTAEEFQEWLDSGDHKAEYAPAEMVKIGERLRKKYDLPKAAGNQIIHNAAYGPNVKPGSDEAKWRKWFEEGGAKEITPVADYYTTPGARELNHKFKDGDPKAITKMASQMAGNVKPGQVLVPMPDRTGKAGNTLKLAKEIAKITGNPVKNLLSGNDRESWYETKKKGKTAPDFGFKVKGKVPENTLIIDNVYDTGETMKQAQKALGGSEYLVHSKVDTPTAKKVAKGGGDTPVGDTQTRAIAAVGDKEYKKRVAAAIKDRRAEDNADWIKEKITRSAGINILAEEFRKTEAGKDLPEPNDHGVYPDEAAERLSYNPKTKVNRAKVDLDVLQLADGIWALGYDYKSRNAGSSSGISASETYETRDEAFVSGLQGAKRHFTQVVDSTLTTTSKVEKAEGKKVLKWVDAELEKFPAQAEKKSTAKKVAKGGGDTPVGDSTLALGDIVRTKDGDIGKILKFTYVNPKAVVNLIPGGPIADYLNDSLTLLPDGVPERAQIAAGGKAVKIFIPSTGAEIKAKLTVVSGKDLIPSHDKDGAVNPEYPEQLQPRDRKKGASRIQIGKMSSNLKPELLADSGSVDSGSPIIGTDGIVESGNARTLAILKAYEKGKAKKYLAYLRKNAESYGLTKADINAMEHPVLVRVRQGKMTMTERAEFARLANESGTAPMTPAETAKADAARITDDDMKVYAPSDDGNILAPSNRSFLTTFGSRLGDLASGGMTTTDGGWTKQFADRVQAAVFHKAYENEALLALMAEEADPGIKNILAALGQAAPAFARARSAGEMGDLDLIADMVTAIELIKQTNVQGASIDQLLNQEDMFGGVDPAVGKIAKFIEDNIRSAKKLGEGFSKMAAGLEAEMAQQQQEGLFDLPPISKSDLVPESEAEPAAGQSDEELELHELSVEDHIKELEKAVFVEGRSDAWLTPSTRNKDGVESEKSISRYEKGLRDVGWESFIKGKGDFWRKDGAELFLRSQGTLSSPLVQFTAPTPEQEAADFKEEIGEVAADPRVKSEKVVLIACCKQKGEKAAPARELYKSPLFKTRLEYAESLNPDRILILSAKHGLLELDQVIEPYDISMKGKSPEEKRNWARVAYNKISTMLQPTGSEFIFLTGKDYRTELSKLLGQHPDAKITVPFEGLGIGAQLMDMKRANAESDKAGLKIVKGEGSRNPESGDLWVAADHVLKTVWGVGRTKQQATEDAQEAIDDWDGDTPKLSFLRIPFETDVDGYFDGKPGELYDLAMSPDQIQPASKKTEAKTKPVAKSEEWVTPFAKDEYKPGDRVEIIEDGSGSVDFTDDDGKIWVTLDSANVMDKGVSFTPEELRHEEDFSKRPSPFKTIDDVLRASAQAGGVYNSLTNIKLTADTGKKKIVHTAEYWLNAIDSRIKAMNELRGCAK